MPENREKNRIKVFDKIDSEEKAYWLGFFQADGNMFLEKSSCKRIYIGLSSIDLAHLKCLESFFGFTNRITTRKRLRKDTITESCELKFASAYLFKSLLKLGITPNKGQLGTFTDFKHIPFQFQRHFWRGYMDGDGCIGKNQEGLIMCFNNNTYTFFLDFLKNIKLDFAHKKHRTLTKENDVFLSKIRVRNQISLILLAYFYDNCTIKLERKYIQYLENKNKRCNSFFVWENEASTHVLKKQKNITSNTMLFNYSNFKKLNYDKF